MKPATLFACLCLTAPASFSMAQHEGHGAATGQNTEAVNAMCPVGKEPIDGKTFVQHDGKTIGFCCPGCDKQYETTEGVQS